MSAALPSDDTPVLDAGYLEEMSRGDRDFEARLVAAFQASAREVIPALDDALGAANAALAGALAHRLRGASLTVGAAALAAVATEVEARAETGSLDEARRAFTLVELEHTLLTGVFDDRLAVAA